VKLLSAIVILFAGAQVWSQESGALGIPSGTYALDQTHTYVTFSYLHQGLSHPLLRAVGVDGELTLDAEDLSNSRVAIAIETDSIRSNVDYFDEELASPKFFNAARFPHITFVADEFTLTDSRSGTLHGEVTIRGISKPLALAVTINGAMEHPMSGKPVIGLSAGGELKRSDFELDRFIPAVSDRVTLSIEAEFAEGSTESSAAAASLGRDGERAAGG